MVARMGPDLTAEEWVEYCSRFEEQDKRKTMTTNPASSTTTSSLKDRASKTHETDTATKVNQAVVIDPEVEIDLEENPSNGSRVLKIILRDSNNTIKQIEVAVQGSLKLVQRTTTTQQIQIPK
ncbi:MAG: hypothetical protein S4CHLAM20_03350 [Chlamydiia bacterium]|nr:hypothetical protein [Chlamydiia bacterium]